jgi:hypothetical protein
MNDNTRESPEFEYLNSLKLTKEAIDIYRFYLIKNSSAAEISFKEMPKYADVDYEAYFDGVFNHYVEVKVRYHWWGKYIQEKIPFRKFAVAYTMKNVYNKNTVYLLRTTNKIGILDLFEKPDDVENMVARHDRGEDKDLYAFYNVNRFKIIDSQNTPQYKFGGKI